MKVKVNSMAVHTQVQLKKALGLHQKGELEAAKTIYQEILKKNPSSFHALHLLGAIAAQRQDHELAVDLIKKAVAVNSNDAQSHYNLGFSLQGLKQFDLALTSYGRAVYLNPEFANAFSNRASVFEALYQFTDALADYNQALVLNPLNAEDYSNRAVVLRNLGRFEESITDCDRAIKIKSDLNKVYYNRGLALVDLKRLDEAVKDFEKELSINPANEYLPGMLQHNRMKLCEWSEYSINIANLRQTILAGHKVSPFIILTLIDCLSVQRRSAELWISDKYLKISSLGSIAKRARRRKIRIGYYSADFYNHATAYLMAGLFEHHNKEKLELIAFSFGPDKKDEMQIRVAQAFDQFIDVTSLSDEAVAQLSRELGIDIAVDLKGLTEGARPGIFSYKAAPVQVSFLGYPGTSGADYIDYLIADRTLIPQQSQQYYSEKIVYLPNSYQVNDRQRFIAPVFFTKRELGLPEDVFIFCCFNNSYKITPNVFDTWIRILKTVDKSVLWLLGDHPTVITNLRRQAQSRGLDPARLVFAERMPPPEHLARHQAADLFLDTLPYNAHTTASDALWADLPIVTCLGESFASRVAASLLNAIGLTELITQTAEGYEALAIELATKPEKLQNIKNKLAANRLRTPLFDTAMFARHIEEAYVQMYERYQADLMPDHLTV